MAVQQVTRSKRLLSKVLSADGLEGDWAKKLTIIEMSEDINRWNNDLLCSKV